MMLFVSFRVHLLPSSPARSKGVDEFYVFDVPARALFGYPSSGVRIEVCLKTMFKTTRYF